LRRRLSQNGAQLIRERYTLARIMDQTEAAFQQVISNCRTSPPRMCVKV